MIRYSTSVALLGLCLAGSAVAGDWAHWRGPEMDGHSHEVNLPSEWSPETVGENNLIWKQPYGCRSTPIVLDGRLYIIQGYGSGIDEGERVVCFDAETGEVLWKHEFNVFLTDIVSVRLGWSSPCGDPETGYVYAHGTQGFLMCLDKEGNLVWERQLTEEFGRVTGYGGRIVNPTVVDDLVIMGMAAANWGEYARGWNRFVAFDKHNGNVVWWASVPGSKVETYYSNPVPGVFNGEKLVISGGSDGGVHAFQARTGKHAWSYYISDGIINGSPIVEGNLVYITHGEDNPDTSRPGRVVCLDASTLDAEGKPTLVWEYVRGQRFGLASAALADGKLYCPDDFAKIYCFDAKTGDLLWRAPYGRVARGSPLIADNKMYVFDVNAEFHIFELFDDEEPEEIHTQKFINPDIVGFVETNGTPIAVNGKVYFGTADEFYCIGTGGDHPEPTYEPLPPEAPVANNPDIDQVGIYPAEVTLHPGESQQFEVRFYNKLGQVADISNIRIAVEFSIAEPPMGKGPPEPALQGEIDRSGKLTVSADVPNQQGHVMVKVGEMTAKARVRVAPVIPYTEDFERYEIGACPGGYVYAQGKYRVVELEGNKVLQKTNDSTRPPLARANAYMTTPDSANYTIACDIMAMEKRGKLPDAGVVNCRYQLTLNGVVDPEHGQRTLRIGAWEAIPRINESMPFEWKPGVWYRMKLKVVADEEMAHIYGKVWERDQEEPAEWTVEFEDPNPTTEGSAAVYGFVTNTLADPSMAGFEGSELYYDNVEIRPNE